MKKIILFFIFVGILFSTQSWADWSSRSSPHHRPYHQEYRHHHRSYHRPYPYYEFYFRN